MITFKIEVSSHIKKDGLYPIYIRITTNRVIRRVRTPYFASKKEIDKNRNIKDPDLIAKTNSIYNDVKKILDDLGFKIEAYSPDELKEYVERKLKGENERLDFFVFADQFINDIINEQPRTCKNHKSALNNLSRYLGDRKLNILHLNSNFLNDYYKWMKKSGGNPITDKKMKTIIYPPLGERGASLYLGSIRTIFYEAQRKYNDYDKGEILIPSRPFEKFIVPKYDSTGRAEEESLPAEKIRQIFNYDPKFKRDELARDVYMLSFFLCGINTIDLYKATDIIDGRLRFFRSKIERRKKSKSELQIFIEPEAIYLFEKYKGRKRVFNFSELYSSEDTFNQSINKGLKYIGNKIGVTNLKYYSARDSWATIAANNCEIDSKTIDMCLAHTDNTMLSKYIKKDWDRVRRANRKVIDYIFEQK